MHNTNHAVKLFKMTQQYSLKETSTTLDTQQNTSHNFTASQALPAILTKPWLSL